MENAKGIRFVRFVLFSNGLADLAAAVALCFPVLKIPLPGYTDYTPQIAFVAGGWGIAALTFGIGRIWTSAKPEFYKVMVILGFLEGSILTLFCLVNAFFLDVSWLQVMPVLFVSAPWGVLYLAALRSLQKTRA